MFKIVKSECISISIRISTRFLLEIINPVLDTFFFLNSVGPPISQSSLINSRDQPGTSAVPNLAPVGARLPPPLPQNLLYTVSESK
jgi:hypothetical protein